MRLAAAFTAIAALFCFGAQAQQSRIILSRPDVTSEGRTKPAGRPANSVTSTFEDTTFDTAANTPADNPIAHHVDAERLLRISPSQAWLVLGRFCAISQWQSLVSSCDVLEREGGIVRIVVMRDHSVFTERLDEFSNERRSFTYSLIAGPLVPPDYRATFSIHQLPQAADASVLRMKAEFSAAPARGAQISGQLRQLFENGLNGITNLLANQYNANGDRIGFSEPFKSNFAP